MSEVHLFVNTELVWYIHLHFMDKRCVWPIRSSQKLKPVYALSFLMLLKTILLRLLVSGARSRFLQTGRTMTEIWNLTRGKNVIIAMCFSWVFYIFTPDVFTCCSCCYFSFMHFEFCLFFSFPWMKDHCGWNYDSLLNNWDKYQW